MLIKNKYSNWYMNIIDTARTTNRKKGTGIERHHIIPKCMGGSNTKDNLVLLTVREHFVCHLLLTKCTDGNNRYRMLHAVGKFIQNSPLQQRKFTSWEYKKIRDSISIAHTGKKHSAETREKMSANGKGRIPWNKGITGIVHSDESNRKRSATIKGRKMSPEFCQKVSDGKKGKVAGMIGKTHSEETKQLMSKNMSKPKGPQKRIDECPHCKTKTVTVRHIKFCKK